MAVDTCKDTVWYKKYKVNLDSFDSKRKYFTRAEYTIYTDGNKIKKGVGAGAVIYHKTKLSAC